MRPDWLLIDGPADQVQARLTRRGSSFYIPNGGCGVTVKASVEAVDSLTSRLAVESMQAEVPCDRTISRDSLGWREIKEQMMSDRFPGAIPEIRSADVSRAAVYYEKCLGFQWDWGVDGLGQVSRGDCRIFLTDDAFAGDGAKRTPVVIWPNLESRTEIDELHAVWSKNGANIVSKPEAKPWNLYEFTAADLDGNLLRVFYDFAFELPDRGGRRDDMVERESA